MDSNLKICLYSISELHSVHDDVHGIIWNVIKQNDDSLNYALREFSYTTCLPVCNDLAKTNWNEWVTTVQRKIACHLEFMFCTLPWTKKKSSVNFFVLCSRFGAKDQWEKIIKYCNRTHRLV